MATKAHDHVGANHGCTENKICKTCWYLLKLKLPVICWNSLYERQFSSISYHEASSSTTRASAWR